MGHHDCLMRPAAHQPSADSLRQAISALRAGDVSGAQHYLAGAKLELEQAAASVHQAMAVLPRLQATLATTPSADPSGEGRCIDALAAAVHDLAVVSQLLRGLRGALD